MSPFRRRRPPASRNGQGPSRGTRTPVDPSARIPLLARILARPEAGSPWPPYGRAILRGFAAVAWSWATLATAFILTILLWLALVATGFVGPLGRIASLLAIPPLSTYADALNASATFGYGNASFAATGAALVVRSVVTAVLAGLAVGALESWTWRLAVLRGLRAVPASLIAGLLGLGVLIFGSVLFPLLGPGLAFLGSILALLAALFAFVHAPIAAVVEPLPAVEAVRKGMRASGMAGSRHLLLCVAYFFLALPILPALAPGGSDLGVNPSLAAWAFAFLAAWVHVGFLAAFAYRYLAVREAVPAAPPRRPRAPRPPRSGR